MDELLNENITIQQATSQNSTTKYQQLSINNSNSNNNLINHSLSQNSTSSGYCSIPSGRSTPIHLQKQLIQQQQQQQQMLAQQQIPNKSSPLKTQQSQTNLIDLDCDQTFEDFYSLNFNQLFINENSSNNNSNTLMASGLNNESIETNPTSSFLNDDSTNFKYSISNFNDTQTLINNRSVSLNNVLNSNYSNSLNSSPFHQLNNQFLNNGRRERSLDRQYFTNNNNHNGQIRYRSNSVNKFNNYLNESSEDYLQAFSQLQQQQQQHTLNNHQTFNTTNGNVKREISSNSLKSLNLNSANITKQQQQQQQFNKINLIKELQVKLMDSQKEVNHLKYELELAQQKLNASISSIKNFWSPELKKERLARKDDFFKYQQLQEKYKLLVYNEANSPTCSNKEINLLKKTICELEIRIETQKQNITSKDETIKSLFSLLNSKDTLSSSNDFLMLKQIEQMDQKALDVSSSAALAAAEQRVNYLENQNILLQEELKLYTSTVNQTSQNQIDLFKSNEKYLKEKIETLKFDLTRKDNECQALKTKYESVESKEKDTQHYLNLLKESLSNKDQQIVILQSEINDLRTRLRDKDIIIEKKSQQIQTFQLEKHQKDSDLCELRDQIDIKERKLNVLYRKIDNLEEQIKDKEMQINTLRSKFNSGLSTNTYHSNEIHSLEQLIEDKEKQIEKLNQAKSTLKEQFDELLISNQELKSNLEKKDKEINDSHNEILDLKDENNILKTQLCHRDSHISSLESSLTQKNEEIEKMEDYLNQQRVKSQQQQQSNNSTETTKKQIAQLNKELQQKDIQLIETFKELNLLKDLVTKLESEKEEMINRLEDQQKAYDDLQSNLNLKIENKSIENHSNTDYINRINELEDAVRQSVDITAQRELFLARQTNKMEKLEQENRVYSIEIEQMKKYLNEQHCQFERLKDDFIKREEQLQTLEQEKVKEMNELLIAKQETLLIAISEKDAQIASLECDKNVDKNQIDTLLNEKDLMHQQLKELNEKRMKLMQEFMSTKDAKDKVKMLVLSIQTAKDEDGLYA